nr:DUF4435 domain-containing protein [Corallococcus sp. AS-1-6]
MRFARESYAVAWRNFIKAVATEPDALFCFFEGEDLKYYSIRINLIARPEKCRSFAVGGRDGVVHLLQLVLNADGGRYAKLRSAFFVDRDFIPPEASDERLYVTPCYSIENMYVSRTAIERIFESEFGLTQGETAMGVALGLYDTAAGEFYRATGELNGWLQQQRKKEAQSKPKGEKVSVLKLQSLQAWEFVDMQFPHCAENYSISTLDQRFGRESNNVDVDAIRDWVADITSNPPAVAYRGKFLIDFLCKFINILVEGINSQPPKYFPAARHVALGVQRKTALSQLSQYADTPSCLIRFLEGVCRRGAETACCNLKHQTKVQG